MMTAGTTKTKWTLTRILAVASPLILVLLWMLTPGESAFKQPVTWQRMSEPGALSAAHEHLGDNCAACHTSIKGVEPSNWTGLRKVMTLRTVSLPGTSKNPCPQA